MRTKKFNDEVLFADEPIVKVGQLDVESLKELAAKNPRKRVRLCAHDGVEDGLHEMFIIHTNDTYVRPHKHLNKSESIHVLEGTVDVVIFDEDGDITEVTQLGDYSSGRQFFHRMSDPRFHTLIINSDTVAFHETTNGPFNPKDTIWAPWAPASDEENEAQASEFLVMMRAKIQGIVG